MDVSLEYVKMCEKAGEIQESWNPLPGDFIYRKFTIFGEEVDRKIWPKEEAAEINVIYWKSQVGGYWVCSNGKGESRIYKHPADMKRETCIWLPRQDQLQRMVDGNSFEKIALFNGWLIDQFEPIWEDSQIPVPKKEVERFSIEQLWFAFVVMKKFNKKWNGEDWNQLINE